MTSLAYIFTMETCPGQDFFFGVKLLLVGRFSKCLSLVHVRNLHPGANLHPGCIFGHVNGVLRICTICTRVKICSNSRGGANLFAPGCKLST